MATGQDGMSVISQEGLTDTRSRLHPFTKLLFKIAEEIDDDTFEKLRILCKDKVSKYRLEKAKNSHELFQLLVDKGEIMESDTCILEEMLQFVNLHVLSNELKAYCPIKGPSITVKMKTLVDFLQAQYQGHFATLQPIPWNDDLQLKLGEMYTRLEVEKVTRGAMKAGHALKQLHDMFKTDAYGKSAQRIRIEGPPALGKSTLCRKIAYDWACGELKQYKLLIFLEMKHVTELQVVDEIFSQLLPKDLNITKKDLTFILKALLGQTLYLFDGLDEIDEKSIEKSEIADYIKGKRRSYSTIVITTRPRLRDKYLQKCDLFLVVKGFTETSTDDYIDKYFIDDPDAGEALKAEIKKTQSNADNIISDLLSNPLHVSFLCILWEDYLLDEGENDFPKNLTEFYSEVLECILKRYSVKNGIDLCDGEIPKAVIDKRDSLASDSYKVHCAHRSVFKQSDISSKESLDLGLLVRDLGHSRTKAKERYFFYHQTWLEFFVALHVSSQLGDRNNTALEALLEEPQKSLPVLKFLAGISDGKNFSLLLDTINQKIRNEKEGKYTLYDTGSKIAQLMGVSFECVYEARYSQNIASFIESSVGGIIFSTEEKYHKLIQCCIDCDAPYHSDKFLPVDRQHRDLRDIVQLIELYPGLIEMLRIHDPDLREISMLSDMLAGSEKECKLKSLEIYFDHVDISSSTVFELPEMIRNGTLHARIPTLKLHFGEDNENDIYGSVLNDIYASVASNRYLQSLSITRQNIRVSDTIFPFFEEIIDKGPQSVELILMGAESRLKNDQFKPSFENSRGLCKFIQTCKETESIKLSFSEEVNDSSLDYSEVFPSSISPSIKSFSLLLSETVLRGSEDYFKINPGRFRAECIPFRRLSTNTTLTDISVGYFKSDSFFAACDIIKNNTTAKTLSIHVTDYCKENVEDLVMSLRENKSLEHLIVKNQKLINPQRSFEECIMVVSKEMNSGMCSLKSVTCCGKELQEEKNKNVVGPMSNPTMQHRWLYDVSPHCSGYYEHKIGYCIEDN